MVSYLYHNIDRHNPLALFGMVWVLEGTSVGIGGQMAEKNPVNVKPTAFSNDLPSFTQRVRPRSSAIF